MQEDLLFCLGALDRQHQLWLVAYGFDIRDGQVGEVWLQFGQECLGRGEVSRLSLCPRRQLLHLQPGQQKLVLVAVIK
jgi:hypothetical protein